MNNTMNDTPGYDDPNRGPLDRAANAVTGGTGGLSDATGGGTASSHMDTGQSSVVSAVFDSQDEAQRAISQLRSAGFDDNHLSLIARSKGTLTTSAPDGTVTDEEHTNVLRGILGGGALGAGLGVAALAIPGVGPLAALGAIAGAAVPEAMAVGAAVGAAAGTFNEVLMKHGVSEDDANYYNDQMKSGGTLITVHTSGLNGDRAREILYANGGHSASRAKSAAM